MELDTPLFGNVFCNKKVFITGVTGFKGAWLALWLKKLGAQVIGYSLPPPSDPSLFALASLEKEIDYIEGDINDYYYLQKVLSSYAPEMVFHMAAQPLVLESYKNPLLTIQTNVMGTVNLLEAIRGISSIKVTVLATSDKCYEKQNRPINYREEDHLGGADPYSASKGAVEILSASYSRSFFSAQQGNRSIATVRAGNVIGGGDWALDRLIPDCIRSFESGKPIYIRNPFFVRPWQHVLEALSGYLLLAAKMDEDPHRYSGAWNFGPKNEDVLSVREVVHSLATLFKDGYPIIEDETIDKKLHEDKYLHLNCDKASEHLKWQPSYNSLERIRLTWDWYHSYFSKKTEIKNLCFDQIQQFENISPFCNAGVICGSSI